MNPHSPLQDEGDCSPGTYTETRRDHDEEEEDEEAQEEDETQLLVVTDSHIPPLLLRLNLADRGITEHP